MKQGCPTSLTLFNLGIDLLIRCMKRDFSDFGFSYKMWDINSQKKVQTYSDDLLLFAAYTQYLGTFIYATCDSMS
jgi:hypothetical protein